MAAIGIGWMRFGGPTGRPAKRAESDVRLLAASCGWFRAACLVREGFHGGSRAYVLPFGASLKPLAQRIRRLLEGEWDSGTGIAVLHEPPCDERGWPWRAKRQSGP